MTPKTLAISMGGNYARCLPYLIENLEAFPDTILYGVTWKEACDISGGIPLPLIRSMECIEKYGLGEEHIYQEGGSVNRMKEYIYAFNSGMT